MASRGESRWRPRLGLIDWDGTATQEREKGELEATRIRFWRGDGGGNTREGKGGIQSSYGKGLEVGKGRQQSKGKWEGQKGEGFKRKKEGRRKRRRREERERKR